MLIFILQRNKSNDETVIIYYNAWSHNDYQQEIPLFRALEYKIGYIEVDVFYDEIDNQLYVSHEYSEINKSKTLSGMYLEPLKTIIDEYSSPYSIENDDRYLNLVIDFKTEFNSTYKVLHEILSNYSGIITSFHNTNKTQKHINVIISGFDNVVHYITNNDLRYISIDGRINVDLYSNINHTYMPIISQSFVDIFPHFDYNSMLFNETEYHILTEMINITHNNQQRLRFWDTIENETLWQQLMDADPFKDTMVIGSNFPDRLASFLDNYGYN